MHTSLPKQPFRSALPALLFNVVGTALAVTVGLSSTASANQTPQQDITLQVGIVQRFGGQPKDTLTLTAPAGDQLTLRFKTKEQEQTVTSNTVKLDVVMQPLPEAVVEERVVLSTHRSFESAEDDANRWRSQGLEVELAQPGRWQVWAKREVYSSPLLRRLLLQSLQAKGNNTAFIDSQVLRERPRASFVVNGYRYTRDDLQVAATKGRIQVKAAVRDDRYTHLYAGTLRLQPNAYGTYTLVNPVPLETYLRGVLPHEIGTWARPAVLETQAVLARTYALRNLRRFATDGYQLCADTQCQVYNGLSGAAPETDRAIAATRGMVLTYQNELVDAVYSAATGGVTAAFNDVWHGAERPYLRPVIDAVTPRWDLANQSLADEQNFRRFIQLKKGFNEEESKWFRWREEVALKELNNDLRKYLISRKSPLANFKTIQQLQVTQRSLGGRVQKMRVTLDNGVLELEKDNILVAFYAPNSILFYLDPMYDASKQLKGYVFVGGGLGHGVGLSQTGSYRLGDLGWSSNRILSFYYPGTQLQPISDAIVFWRDPFQPASANQAQQ